MTLTQRIERGARPGRARRARGAAPRPDQGPAANRCGTRGTRRSDTPGPFLPSAEGAPPPGRISESRAVRRSIHG
ncbi:MULTISPECIES: hypothetical protein [unclassified Streptomyces]|uniref:hypothetical protein n=1 Tax=unclassified Streptomyces TaxID=2593676 RepID=UPI0007DD1989|nr:hypothetical protein [Streptomyces sp. SAT1]ANH90094.1 hypothetical protein A8713_02215 [Streptomyces sp. SAT1]